MAFSHHKTICEETNEQKKKGDILAPTPNFDWAEDVEMEELSMFSCPQCPAKVKERKNLYKHYYSVHKVFKCYDCSLSFHGMDVLKRHKVYHTQRNNKWFQV